MAEVKNYGLSGVGVDLQFGKKGGHFKWQAGSGTFAAVAGDNTTLVPVRGRVGVQPEEFVTVSQLQGVAGTGLVVKPAVVTVVQADQTAALEAAAWDPLAGGGTITVSASVSSGFNVGDTVGGVVLTAAPIRVLVRWLGITPDGLGGFTVATPQALKNGLYQLTPGATDGTTSAVFVRAAESNAQDEVNYNNYVFVNDGTDVGDSFVISKLVAGANTPLVLNTDPITWVTFSNAATFGATQGVRLDGSNFVLDIDGLTSAPSTLNSTVAFGDGAFGGFDNKTTLGNMFSTLDVVTSAAITDGILVKTANDQYAGRTITVGSAALAGLAVTNGNGVAGDPVVGLDILNTAAIGTTLALTDSFLVYDLSATSNVRATIQDITDIVSANTSANIISQLDSSVIVTDTGTDGTITITADGTAVAVFTATGAAITGNLSATGNVSGVDGTFSGNVSGVGGTFSGNVGAVDGAFSGDVTAASVDTGAGAISGGTITGTALVGGTVAGTTGTFSGNVSAVDVTASGNVAAVGGAFSGAVTAASVDAGAGAISGGAISGTTGTFSGAVSATNGTFDGNVTSTSLVTTPTATNMVYAGTSGQLAVDDTNAFEYDPATGTLTVNKINAAGGIDLDLVENQLVYGDAAGVPVSSAAFAVDPATSTLSVGTVSVNGVSQTISGTLANGDISIVPNGTGEVVIGGAGAGVISSDTGQTMTIASDTGIILDSTGGTTVSNLTLAGGMVFTDGTGLLSQDAGFTYDAGTDTLTVGNISLTGGIDINLTPTEVVFGSSTGSTETSANLTFVTGTSTLSTVNLVASGTGAFTGAVTAASVDTGAGAISGGTITGTALVGGTVEGTTGTFSGAVTAASVTTASVTAAASDLTLTSTGDNIALVLAADKLVLATNAAAYDAALASNTGNALITKSYAQSLIQTGASANSVKTVIGTVDLGTNTNTNIGAELPAGATVLSVRVNVTATNADSELAIGSFMTVAENDPSVAGLYIAEVFSTNGSAVQVVATVTGATVAGGSADVIVEYRVPA